MLHMPSMSSERYYDLDSVHSPALSWTYLWKVHWRFWVCDVSTQAHNMLGQKKHSTYAITLFALVKTSCVFMLGPNCDNSE